MPTLTSDVEFVRVACPEASAQAVRVRAVLEAERTHQVVYSAVVWRQGVAVVALHTRERAWNPTVVLEHDSAVQMQKCSPVQFVA